MKDNHQEKQDVRICFVGDSLVNGTGDETVLGWTGRVCALANKGSVSITHYNLGIRGNTSRDIALRIESEVGLRLASADDKRVVLSFGVNDTLLDDDGKPRVSNEASLKNLNQIVNLLALNHELLMIGPLPVDDDCQNQRIDDLNQLFKHQMRELKLPYIDVFQPLISNAGYCEEIANTDGAHPKSQGYATIASVILESDDWWFT